ncbi:MAG TPA: hypothetical protein PKU78_02785 [Candidatus Dojkabacteria bacterium]|nr:hypothetical protein [Candidatus Dojkabacteria bacterium]HRO65120.1 hypothetical protein [Candidatus Dojkabacteria bacterium]HRP51803.1 hypothetical protein [Candidatus Dojkabacteria bacterium]
MLNLLNRYFLNYFIWWYLVQSKIILGKVFGGWMFLMNLLNVPPMLKNLFQPLYQDYTRMGRIIAFPIRLTWVLMGLFIELLLLPIILIIFIIYLILPVIPIYGFASFLLNA